MPRAFPNLSVPACFVSLSVAGAVLPPPAAEAIVIRHDRDDALYRALGANYPATVYVGGAAGVVIDPRWVLTAAHVAEGASPYLHVRLGERWIAVENIVLHPEYEVRGMRSGRDLALLKLAEPATGVEPVLLYDRDDEIGQRVTFVGWGWGGHGLTGPAEEAEPVLRGAHNRVETANEASIRFTFDTPPHGEELEGISGPGDSGGPAYLERDGKLYTIGVSSTNSGGGENQCTYGTIETYARVSTARQWIEQVIEEDAPPAIAWGPQKPLDGDLDALPDSPGGRMMAQFLRSFNMPDSAGRWDFEEAHLAPQELRGMTPEQRRERYKRSHERFGQLEPLAYREADPMRICVLVRSQKSGERFSVMPVYHATEAGKLRRVSIEPVP